MKKILLIISTIISSQYSFGQTNTFPGTGNVGIGTVSPSATLDIENGNALVSNDMLGGLGGQISIRNGYGNQNGAVRLNLNNGGAVSWIKGIVTGVNTNLGSAIVFGVPSNTSDGIEVMRITGNGFLGIGTTTPDSRLSVNGTIHSKEVKVDVTGWPDYVFKQNYKLLSLIDVKSYIDKNNHLPDMPSEKIIAEDGLNLGEMNKLLVKKIEELTLYLIEQNGVNQIQQQQINALNTKVKRLTKK